MQVADVVKFLAKEVLEVEFNRIKSVFTERVSTTEQAFIKFEYIANVFGYVVESGYISGQIRIVVGIVQMIVFSGQGIFHWCCSASPETLLYDREIVVHGAGNVLRGVLESLCSPYGNWIVLIYAFLGQRLYYTNERRDIPIPHPA